MLHHLRKGTLLRNKYHTRTNYWFNFSFWADDRICYIRISLPWL